MKKFIIILLVTLLTVSLIGCNNTNIGDYSSSSLSSSSVETSRAKTKKTSAEAIQEVKEGSLTEYWIAAQNGIKFVSRIDWGTCTATLDQNDRWEVTLKGNISGYTDDYKTEYVRKAFTYTSYAESYYYE